MSVKDALLSYNKRQLQKTNWRREPKRRNQKPEKQVEKDCLKWLRDHKFDVDIIEAKCGGAFNAFNVIPVRPGFSDCCGNDSMGNAVFIEFKAPGRRSTVSVKQVMFLQRKIKSNCFAIVTDNALLLESLYNEWLRLKQEGKLEASRMLLLDSLPKKRSHKARTDSSPLFPD